MQLLSECIHAVALRVRIYSYVKSTYMQLKSRVRKQLRCESVCSKLRLHLCSYVECVYAIMLRVHTVTLTVHAVT